MKVDFPMRSLMFVPGHNLKLMNSAIKSEADILLLDLEDAVPKNSKQTARNNIIDFVKQKSFRNFKVFPRVNNLESGELLKDVLQLSLEGIDGFVYPKSKKGEDIFFFDKLLEAIEYDRGFKPKTFKIIALVETASAVLHAEEICKASARVIAIAFGHEDYLTDTEGVNDEAASTLFTARNLIVMAARSQNVTPIDTIHPEVHDLNDLEYNLKISKKLGFGGMLVLHPKELPLVHRYFTPTAAEIMAADKMIKALKESEKGGRGVSIVNGKFVGPPLAKHAQKVLDKYRRYFAIKPE